MKQNCHWLHEFAVEVRVKMSNVEDHTISDMATAILACRNSLVIVIIISILFVLKVQQAQRQPMK